MTYNIITNLDNGAGLERDYQLLRKLLESYGHQVTGTQFNHPHNVPKQHDVNIFVEVVAPEFIPHATQNWIVPNSEWWYPCWDPILPKIDFVLCKTQDCLRLWQRKVDPARCKFTGFESHDFYRLERHPRRQEFLHMAGKSETKNTLAVVEAWRSLPYPLTVVCMKAAILRNLRNLPANVTHIERLTNEQVIQYMNDFEYHVMPSKNEGFGHYIHEAIGCGGIVLTTNAPPMNEFHGVPKELLIRVQRREPRLMTFFHLVDPADIAAKVKQAVALSGERKAEIHHTARAAFLSDREQFRAAFAEIAR